MYKICDTTTGLFLSQENKFTRKGRIYHDLGGVKLRLLSAAIVMCDAKINAEAASRIEYAKNFETAMQWNSDFNYIRQYDPECIRLRKLTDEQMIAEFIPDSWVIYKYEQVISETYNAKERMLAHASTRG